MVGWYDGYIPHRDLIFEIQDTKIPISNGIDFPQGGVASAKFQLIAFDPAVAIINTHGVFGNAFADDCREALGGTHLPTIVKHLHTWELHANLVVDRLKQDLNVLFYKLFLNFDLKSRKMQFSQTHDLNHSTF